MSKKFFSNRDPDIRSARQLVLFRPKIVEYCYYLRKRMERIHRDIPLVEVQSQASFIPFELADAMAENVMVKRFIKSYAENKKYINLEGFTYMKLLLKITNKEIDEYGISLSKNNKVNK